MSGSKMSDTIVFAGIATDGDHLLGYQNKAQNLNTNLNVNAMIIPVPSSEDLFQDNIFDLSNDKELFKNISESLFPNILETNTRSFSMMKGGDSFQIFKSGNYTVVSASHAGLLSKAIENLNKKMQPKLSDDIIYAYYDWYPKEKWKMTLFIWSGQDQMESDPVLIKYKPSDDSHLFLPGLDGHNGKRPNLRYAIRRDHTLIVGHKSLKNNIPLYFSNQNAKDIFPSNFDGFRIKENDANCDWLVSTKGLEQGKLAAIKYQPAYFEIK